MFPSPLRYRRPRSWRGLAFFPSGPVLRDYVTQQRTRKREIALRIFQKAPKIIMFNLADPQVNAVDAWATYHLQGWRKEVPSCVC